MPIVNSDLSKLLHFLSYFVHSIDLITTEPVKSCILALNNFTFI